MLEQTITQLRQLKLSGMANALVSQSEQPSTYDGLPFEQRLQLLADSEYQNLLITGPCGSGKTYIACAMGHTACMKGYSVKYYRLSRLMLELTQAKADGTYSKALQTLAKLDCLIIDDRGLEPLKAAQRNDLMEIMDDRNETTSTIMISQLPTDQWYQSIGDNTLADAILDRLMHNAHRINLKGESMRKTQSDLTDREHLEVK